MDATQRENNWKAYLRHVRFYELREGWPPLTEKEIKGCYERLCCRAALQVAESRRRRPPADEIVQGLPSLIAADMKKRQVRPPVKSVPRQLQPMARRGHEPRDIKA